VPRLLGTFFGNSKSPTALGSFKPRRFLRHASRLRENGGITRTRCLCGAEQTKPPLLLSLLILTPDQHRDGVLGRG
jgi:hypothetical protein